MVKAHSGLQTPNPVLYLFFQRGLVRVGEAGDSGRKKSQAEPLEAKWL